MMLAQFQSLYPQGSLLTELVQIDHGQYIVKASVQIEGVIRATGMACASILEEAEDRARDRALSVLGITTTSQQSVALSTEPITQPHPNPALAVTSELNELARTTTSNSFPQTHSTSFTPQSNANILDAVAKEQELPFDIPEDLEKSFDPVEPIQGISSSTSNVTPFTPRSYNLQENFGNQTGTAKKKKKSEPVDLSDVIAKTDVEIERLGWTKEQGRDYLKKTYGKIGRTLLSEEELLDFLRYLESQPTPPDPLAGF